MIILLIIGIALGGLAVGLIARALSPPREGDQSGAIRRRIEKYSFSRRGEPEEPISDGGGMKGKLDDVAAKVGGAVVDRSKSKSIERIRTMLVEAGMYNVTPGRFLGYRVLCTVALPIIWIWFGFSIGVKPALAVIITLFIAMLGW